MDLLRAFEIVCLVIVFFCAVTHLNRMRTPTVVDVFAFAFVAAGAVNAILFDSYAWMLPALVVIFWKHFAAERRHGVGVHAPENRRADPNMRECLVQQRFRRHS